MTEHDGFLSETLYVTKFDDGYYAKKQPHYEWSFTDDIAKANTYRSEKGALERIDQANNYLHGMVVQIDRVVSIDIVQEYTNEYKNRILRASEIHKLLMNDLPQIKNENMEFLKFYENYAYFVFPIKDKSYNDVFTFPLKIIDYTDDQVIEYSTTQKQRREKLESSKFFTGHLHYLK